MADTKFNFPAEQKQAILDAWAYCDEQDKSTEFMLSYISDMSGVDYETIFDYIISDEADKDREEYYNTETK